MLIRESVSKPHQIPHKLTFEVYLSHEEYRLVRKAFDFTTMPAIVKKISLSIKGIIAFAIAHGSFLEDSEVK